VHEAAPRRVMIVEGNPDGHRLYYVSLLVRGAIASGCSVTLATTERALSSSEWSSHLGAGRHGAAIALLDGNSLAAVRGLADELKVDHVVIPDGDSFVYELAKGERWSGRSTVTALAMREKGQLSAIPGMSQLMTLAKQASFLLANLRPRVEVRILKSGPWRGFSMLPVVRDPVTLTNHGSERIQLPGIENFWFGIVGRVGHRKNLPLVAAAIASLNRPDVGLVVAGQIEAGVLDMAEPHLERIRDNGGRVEIIDRQLSESEMDQIVVDLDCVVLAHSNEGASGILGKAVASGTRIVAAGASTLRADCRRVGSGAEWVQMREHLLTNALGRAISAAPPQASHLASPAEFTAGMLGHRS
jgi:glycosyltransferase involved in cell wall biosynthesis